MIFVIASVVSGSDPRRPRIPTNAAMQGTVESSP
jgi:hypothetical protein